jgi:hypothetical protein
MFDQERDHGGERPMSARALVSLTPVIVAVFRVRCLLPGVA